MLRSVRGNGELVPEEIRWVSAQTDGRVEKIVVDAGARVTPDTVILELSNPELEQAAQDAELQLRRPSRPNTRISRSGSPASSSTSRPTWPPSRRSTRVPCCRKRPIASCPRTADLLDRAAQVPARRRVSSPCAMRWSRNGWPRPVGVDRRPNSRSSAMQVDQQRALYRLRATSSTRSRSARASPACLQDVPVEEGERVTPGIRLARVAEPEKLKAELRINETQAKDIEVGQVAKIDTRNGIIEGRVARIDPAVQQGTVTVDVALLKANCPRARGRTSRSTARSRSSVSRTRSTSTGRPTARRKAWSASTLSMRRARSPRSPRYASDAPRSTPSRSSTGWRSATKSFCPTPASGATTPESVSSTEPFDRNSHVTLHRSRRIP